MLIKIHVPHFFFHSFHSFSVGLLVSPMSAGNLRLPAAALIPMMKLYSFVWISVYIIYFIRAVQSLYCFEERGTSYRIK